MMRRGRRAEATARSLNCVSDDDEEEKGIILQTLRYLDNNYSCSAVKLFTLQMNALCIYSLCTVSTT
jgi:hypothetical protein